jgi:hypothetical protein
MKTGKTNLYIHVENGEMTHSELRTEIIVDKEKTPVAYTPCSKSAMYERFKQFRTMEDNQLNLTSYTPQNFIKDIKDFAQYLNDNAHVAYNELALDEYYLRNKDEVEFIEIFDQLLSASKRYFAEKIKQESLNISPETDNH